MKVSAILLSRVLAFIDTADLSPQSAVFAPDFVREIASEFQFQKVPETIEEFDLAKGMSFNGGKFGKRTISKFSIWPNLLSIETRSHTTEAKELLHEMLLWGKEKFNLAYSEDMIRHYGYVSDLSIDSKAPLTSISPLLERIASRTSKALSEIWQEPIKYEPADLKIIHDPLGRKWSLAPFQIARKAEHTFKENRYFSEAPLPTDLHIELLEEFEAGIFAIQGKPSAR